jgi:TPP-dependent trihydroxycyclohexane-1,2-dione (THcHDO) dehydratase
MSTIRLTMAQALVRYLINQFTIVDGKEVPLFPGIFGIFGHGNVTCLSEALEEVKDVFPTWRGPRTDTSSGRHRMHARNPAATASAPVLKNTTFLRWAARDGQEGRQ